MANKNTKINTSKALPKLPRGEGSMDYTAQNGVEYVRYRKTVNGKQVKVYAQTPKEAMQKMREKEKEILNNIREKQEGLITLEQAITEWHKTFKAPGVVLKPRSYDREFLTLQNQILKFPISHMQMCAIDSKDIQGHINELINHPYSYSVVKKTYELLDQFFKYYYIKEPNNNPMNVLKKPTKEAMQVDEKEVEYLNEQDLVLFEHEATMTTLSGKPKYSMGYAIMALIYTGMRINEALALRWGDVNLDSKTVTIRANRSKVIDHEVGLRADGTYQWKVEIGTPKTKNGFRTIPLVDKAYDYLIKHKSFQSHNDDLDFVFCTQNGNMNSERNIRRAINSIQEKSGTSIQNSGNHMTRHTFCSLMCRAGVDEGVVASFLGQADRDMVERVYRHVSENEKLDAAKKINAIKIKL